MSAPVPPPATLQEGWFPLLAAVEADDVEEVEALLLLDATDPDQEASTGHAPPGIPDGIFLGGTALLLAVWHGRAACVEAMLRRADPNKAHPRFGATPACIAAYHGFVDVLRIIRRHGSCLDAVNNEGQSPVFIASEKGRLAAVQFLVSEGADLNRANTEGWTPAFAAAEGDYVEVRSRVPPVRPSRAV